MTTMLKTAWIEPPEPIRGLDHLGSQAPCVALYTQLLPGLTNVTDRARYYSFYPWLIREFERRWEDHSREAFSWVVRRAEILFALAALRHEQTTGESAAHHGYALVGRQSLGAIRPDAETIELDVRAAHDGKLRYFQNRLGGLAQYYFGPLRNLRILAYPEGDRRQPPGYDAHRGAVLADVFDGGVDGDIFFELLAQKTVSWEDLDAVDAFCPCHLTDRAEERGALLDVLFAKSAPYQTEEGAARRASLGLVLDLAGRGSTTEGVSLVGAFRASAYAGHLPDGTVWTPPKSLATAQRGWGTYHRNDLLSVGIEGLFAAVLHAIQRDRNGRFASASAAGDVAVALVKEGLGGAMLTRSLASVVEETARSLPNIGDWLDDGHEVAAAQDVAAIDLDAPEAGATASIGVLLALLARGLAPYPYDAFERLDPDYFGVGEINLVALRQRWEDRWRTMTVDAWVRELAVDWGVQRHLRVALRKLRAERRDTFRVRPLDGHLAVVEVPAPTFTGPRLTNAVHMLSDLGLLAETDEGSTILTALGEQEIEAFHD